MTSYVKMIDIWMLFTMTIPFLEVVLHTTNEVFLQSDFGLSRHKGQMGVVRVKPVGKLSAEDMPETRTSTSSTIMRLAGNLLLPIVALIFTLAFWIVGLIKSYSSASTQGPNMFDCIDFDHS